MDLLHLHLVLNHVPVIGTVVAVLLLVGAMLRRSPEVIRATLALLVVMGLVALGAFFTGEPAEKGLETVPGVSEQAISAHESAAEIALTCVELLAVLALAGLVLFRRAPRIPLPCAALVLFLALVTSGVMGWTANLGGKIRHTELGGTAPVTLEHD